MRLLALIVAGVALALGGCAGASAPKVACPTSFVLNVTPTAGMATHGAQAPGNQATFMASMASAAAPSGPAATDCGPLTSLESSVTWTSSDTVNVTLVSDPETSTVVATCVGPTTVPVTITASQIASGLPGTGTATLTCK